MREVLTQAGFWPGCSQQPTLHAVVLSKLPLWLWLTGQAPGLVCIGRAVQDAGLGRSALDGQAPGEHAASTDWQALDILHLPLKVCTVGAVKIALLIVAGRPVQQRLRAVRVQAQHMGVGCDGCVQLLRALIRAGKLKGSLCIVGLQPAGLSVVCQGLVHLAYTIRATETLTGHQSVSAVHSLHTFLEQGRGSDEVRPQQHSRRRVRCNPVCAGMDEPIKVRVGLQVQWRVLLLAPLRLAKLQTRAMRAAHLLLPAARAPPQLQAQHQAIRLSQLVSSEVSRAAAVSSTIDGLLTALCLCSEQQNSEV